MQQSNCFPQGSQWLRADFHLHTEADKEFNYQGDNHRFVSEYVTALKNSDTHIGVVTNHNKFDLAEFKALRKKARKEDIFLLPGVELSVKEGSNGVHMLVIFSDDWIADGKDYINPFLISEFQGKTPDQYENENGRSNNDILTTFKNLQNQHKSFFVIFAHVEQKNGLWNSLDGGLFQELGKSPVFKKYTLGFQKVRTHDKADKPCRTKVQQWLKDWYPAEVEGCDAKTIDQIGKGECSFLKIGAFNFDAIRFALMDKSEHVTDKVPEIKHSHVQAVHFEGGLMNGQSIHFSSGMNCLIGIRGSGKSSLLEAVRYALNLPFGQKAQDTKYKKSLIEHLLGSGGKIIVDAIDQRGQAYQIHRILNGLPDVYIDNQLQPGVSIDSTILHKPLYFGQKDLSATGEGFETDLVEKLVGQQLVDVRSRIDDKKKQILQIIEHLNNLSDSGEKQQEYEDRLKDTLFKLKFFKDHGVEEKLQEQVEFNRDIKKCEQINSLVTEWISSLDSLLTRFEDELRNQVKYQSKTNADFFEKYFKQYSVVLSGIDTIKDIIKNSSTISQALKDQYSALLTKKDSLKDSFAQIERDLAQKMKDQGRINIRPDEFVQLSKDKDRLQQLVKAAKKQGEQEKSVIKELQQNLVALNELWLEEFRIIQHELEQINSGQTALQITAEFKADKVGMQEYLKQLFRGSKLRDTLYEKLCQDYADFGYMYRELDKITESANSGERFREYFSKNMKALLSWQIPNLFMVKYHGKPLQEHSLGQRASAMMLFILSRKDNDLILIDQPEDDLDNQTIYEDVIKLIRKLKKNVQFIFATHNANFPVLGDAEQVISCTYHSDKIVTQTGSIDCTEIQNDIVGIMEGGEEAFNRRNEIYQLWKP